MQRTKEGEKQFDGDEVLFGTTKAIRTILSFRLQHVTRENSRGIIEDSTEEVIDELSCDSETQPRS